MPKLYTDMRDSCYQKKRKSNNGKLSDKDKKECKKWAAIQYYKKTGNPVKHTVGSFFILFRFYNNLVKNRNK